MSRSHRHSRHSSSSHKRASRIRSPEPKPILQTTRREDGLWESIEADDIDPIPTKKKKQESPKPETNPNVKAAAAAAGVHRVPETHPLLQSAGTQTETAPEPPAAAILKPRAPSTPAYNKDDDDAIPVVISLLSVSPPPPEPPSDTPKVPPSISPKEQTPAVAIAAAAAAASPTPPPPPQKRKRGRPCKKKNPNPSAPPPPPPPIFNTHKRRLRFSAPVPTDPRPALCARDSHVFIRLVRIDILSSAGSSYVWNNRAKGWKPSSSSSSRSSGDEVIVGDLYAAFSEAVLQPVVWPTEGGGARQNVEMDWDAARCCYQGSNGAGETLSVTLGEMREMVRDPWGRQFVGYVMS